MTTRKSKLEQSKGLELTQEKMDQIVAQARQLNKDRMDGYREQSLKLHPWVCARCGREFNESNLQLLTVHHKDHNHNNNPPDGSNWENLCTYCHDDEHGRYRENGEKEEIIFDKTDSITHNPFANLASLLKEKKK